VSNASLARLVRQAGYSLLPSWARFPILRHSWRLFPVRPHVNAFAAALGAGTLNSDPAALGDVRAQRPCTNAVIASTRAFCAAQNAAPFKRRSIGGICELTAWLDGEPMAGMLASVVFDEVECVEFNEVAGLGITAGSGTAYTRSGPIVATAAARRRCAKMSISGQIWITAKPEIAPTAMAPAIPARMSRMGEK
jgi:hypothetical protein